MDVLLDMCNGRLPITRLPSVGLRSMNFFICSAYSDFQLERTILTEKAYPELREYCQRTYGLQFEAIDLKLGLEDCVEEDLGYQKLFVEKREKLCRATADCCPVILLGQKYGLPVLPPKIPSQIYDLIRATLRAHRNSVTRHYAILDQWYKRDENTPTEPEHVLVEVETNIEDINSKNPEMKKEALEEWKKKRRLLSILLKIGFAICLREGSMDEKAVQQILVYELDSALSSVINYGHKSEFSPLIFQREIIDLKNYMDVEKTTDFADLEFNEKNGLLSPDPFLTDLLRELHDRLFSYYASPSEPFSVLWRFNNGIERGLHEDYLNEFCAAFVGAAKRSIDQRAQYKTTHEDPICTRVFDDVWTSMTHTKMLSCFAAGHEEVIDALMSYTRDPTLDVPMVIYGPENSGKAPVVARCFYELQSLYERNSEIFVMARIVLFPTKINAFVQSLSNQFQLHESLRTGQPMEAPVDNIIDFIDRLPKLYKFIILITGTEKLLLQSGEPCKIVELLPETLPENVKLIVTSQKTKEELPLGYLNYPLREFAATEYYNFTNAFLTSNDRRLTDLQCQIAKDCMVSVKNMFQISIIADYLCRIVSFDILTADDLPPTDEDCIRMTLKALDAKYNPVLVSHVAALITASEDGLTDQEIVDLLSMDDEVMEAICQEKEPKIRRFPSALWFLLKQDLRVLLMSVSKDGYFLNYWSGIIIESIISEEYLSDEKQQELLHYMMADYFLGVWHDTPKPYPSSCEEPLAANRLLPSQDIMYKHAQKTFYNVRQYRQLPRHLLLSNRLEELYTIVLFSYNWIYYKTKALGLEEMLKDYEIVEDNIEVNLVEETIRKSTDIIQENLGSLAAELIGQLLPYSYLYKNIKNLVRQCDVSGPVHSGFLPTYPYPKLPGSALQSTVVCPSALQNIYLNDSEGVLMVKLENDCKLYQYDLNKGEMTGETILSHGEVFISTNRVYAVVLDDKQRNTLKVHRVQDGSFIGHVIPLNWIEARPFEERHKFKVTSLDIGNNFMALLLTNQISYIFIVSLETCKPINVFKPDKVATLCKISYDLKYVFTNSAEQLLAFEISTAQQIAAVDLLANPLKAVFTKDMTRAFVLCNEEQRVVVLHLRDGYVEMSYKIVFENSLLSDHITDIKLSAKNNLLLVRGENNILVYDFLQDAIIGHVKRPAEIPVDFKLPNSIYTTLNFTEADFAFDDKVIVSSIFRDVLIWNISDGQPLAMLHAPVGIISRLVVDRERKGLIGYIGHSREIHLWNLNGAFTDGTVIDALTEPISCICVAENDPKAIAVCANSDEMGVVDLQTGFLTDLYTHEGNVVRCAISSCGSYAVVGIKMKKPNTANIVWSLKTRRILKEFGNVTGFYLPYKMSSAIVHVVQEDVYHNAPYEIFVIQCLDNEATVTNTTVKLDYILNEPFITSDDNFAVALSADAYMDRKAYYIGPKIVVWKCGTSSSKTISPSSLSNYEFVTRILDVKPAPRLDSMAIVLFSPEENDYNTLDKPSEENLQKCVMLMDIESETIVQVVDDLLPNQLNVRELVFSSDGQLCVDAVSNLYSMEVGCYLGQLADASMHFHCFILKSSAILLSSGQCLMAFRIPEGTLIGKVNVHENISYVEKCPDERTVVVGCDSGNVLSYTVVDPLMDDVPSVVQMIKSRALLDKEGTRSWDRVVPEDGGTYSRPPSMSGDQHGANKLDDLPPEDPDNVRPTSEPGLGSRAKSCSVM